MSEIISFWAEKEDDREVSPAEKEDILRHLQAVPDDIGQEYIGVIDVNLEQMLIWRNLIAARGNPRTAMFLIDGLDAKQFDRLHMLVMGLVAWEPKDHIRAIVECTFDILIPDEEAVSKAESLYRQVKELDVDHIKKAKELADQSRRLQLLSQLFHISGIEEGWEFKAWLIDRYSTCSPEDLDSLLKISESVHN